MKTCVVVSVLTLVLATSSPSLAWVPVDEDDAEPPVPSVDPAPLIAPPPGLYYVTDTYVADVVTTSGLLTTYATATVHESTGSWARVLDSVPTGGASAFDGLAFNGRQLLSDGRSVAGTYYENYVLTGTGFVPVSVVFFQDDAELARLASPRPTPLAIATPAPVRTIAPAIATPAPREGCCAAARPIAITTAAPVVLRPARPAISLTPAGPSLTRIEVLRGRPVTLWLRAFADDREIAVRSWSIVAGDPGAAVTTSGSGSQPLRTSWSRLAPPGSAFELSFRIEVDSPETGRRHLNAPLTVIVRSPALEP